MLMPLPIRHVRVPTETAVYLAPVSGELQTILQKNGKSTFSQAPISAVAGANAIASLLPTILGVSSVQFSAPPSTAWSVNAQSETGEDYFFFSGKQTLTTPQSEGRQPLLWLPLPRTSVHDAGFTRPLQRLRYADGVTPRLAVKHDALSKS